MTKRRPVAAPTRAGAPTPKTPDLSADGTATTATEAVPEALWQAFVTLGLLPYEARVLVGLLRLGAATVPELVPICGVPRTSIYVVLDAMAARGLVERVPGEGSARWSTPGRDQVLNMLHAAEADRLRQHQERTEQTRELLAQTLPEVAKPGMPFVHILHGAPKVQRTYNRILREARHELVMFTRSPYASGRVNPVVLDTLARGVRARVLYEEPGLDDPSAQEWLSAYHEAGVQARVVPDLPMKLVVVDASVALLAMVDPGGGDYPTTLHIEHPGFAATQELMFDCLWEGARPYEPGAEETAAGTASAG